MSGFSLGSSISNQASSPPLASQTITEGDDGAESDATPQQQQPQSDEHPSRPLGRAKSHKKGSLPALGRVAFNCEPTATEILSQTAVGLTRKPSRGHQRNISSSEPQLNASAGTRQTGSCDGAAAGGPHGVPPARRHSHRVSYAQSAKRPSNESISVPMSRRESQFDGIAGSSASQYERDCVEKPTIHLYPRKSIVTSASLRDIAAKVVSKGSAEELGHIPPGSNTSLSRHVSLKGSGMSKTRSSWSVKSKSAHVIAGVAASRSYGSIRLLSEPQQVPEDIETEPWEHELEDKGEERYATVDGSQLSLGQETQASIQPVNQALAAPSAQEDGARPVSTVGPIDDSYRDNPDYYEYLLLCQRHASSNFIQKIDSSEVVYGPQETIVKVIGPYVLGDQIGKGAFGKVKEGLCSDTLQRVAVKIINKKRLRKMQNGIENVLREIKLLRRMKHTNIITLIDVYCKVEDDEGNVGIFNWFSGIEDEPITWTYDDGTEADKKVQILKWYLIFEYCPCSLQTLLEQADGSKVDTRLANRFFAQLIEGDIKPGNMLITPDGVLKLGDFGVAEQFQMYEFGEMMSQTFAGTHQFLSPEIAEGASEFFGDKVDIWAYNMVTGKYPFEFDEDGNLLTLYERIVSGVFLMPAELDTHLKDIIQGMLTKDPKTRLSIKQLKKHPWTLSYVSANFRPQRPILSYPISEAESPSTPTSPLKNPTNERTKSVKAPKPPTHITPCETTMIPYLQELYAEEIEDDIAENGCLAEMAGEKTSENGESSAPSNEVHTHSTCFPCNKSSRSRRIDPQIDGKGSRKRRRKKRGLRKFFSKLFHSHSSIDPETAANSASPIIDTKKENLSIESSRRSRSPSKTLLSPNK
ncbi:Serine/threonine-protein kinase stk11 [Dinochytrium kinnereticum]|nr:Serine/threonine-protein kinase stk11 [Dinochytrium kinnereticum]